MITIEVKDSIDGLSNEKLKFICNVLEKRGFKNNKAIVEPVGQIGDNYGSNVLRITTVVERGQDFKMIVKVAPAIETVRKEIKTGYLFNNEIVMYEDVLPKFVSLQVAAGVPKNNLLKYAECYGSIAEEPNEIILLEDLNESNFNMFDKMSCLNNVAVKLVLKNFAIFHSLSFVLKKTEADTYDRFKNKLYDMWDIMAEQFKHTMVKLEEDAIKIVDTKYKKYLKGLVSQMVVIGENLKKSDKDSKYLVIQQGDCWTNNIMFKLTGDIPTECIMIDYQVSREVSPVCDFLYMIFNCTDHATRSKYYFEWVDYYYSELDKSLSAYGMEANLVYPRVQLDDDLKRYSQLYFGTAVMVYSVLCKSTNEAAVVRDAVKQDNVQMTDTMTDLENLSVKSVKLFKSRVEDLIDSYCLFGYF